MFASEKSIKAPLLPYHLDFVQQEQFLERAVDFHQNLDKKNGVAPTYTCDNRLPDGTPSSILAFLPAIAADISEANPTASYKGKCFEDIAFEFQMNPDSSFDVVVDLAKPINHTCTETILFGNTELQHIEVFLIHGKHRLNFEMSTPEAKADVALSGIKAFAFCEGFKDELASVWTFIKSIAGGLSYHPWIPYVGSHVPPYMEKACIRFLRESMGWDPEVRTIQKVTVDPDLI